MGDTDYDTAQTVPRLSGSTQNSIVREEGQVETSIVDLLVEIDPVVSAKLQPMSGGILSLPTRGE